MIERLIDNIRAYVDHLSQQHIYVSVHTGFCADMLPLLPLNLHRNPQCLLVKSDSEAWDACIRLPMRPEARSLNLSNSVAITVYEALRQLDFPHLQNFGNMKG